MVYPQGADLTQVYMSGILGEYTRRTAVAESGTYCAAYEKDLVVAQNLRRAFRCVIEIAEVDTGLLC
jgi:hypothetical protein